jgi:carbon storage regulator
MLVLSRQRDETIKIGETIDITIVAIKGDRVRVGINAPPDIPVHRKEVFDEIQQRKSQEAAASPVTPAAVEPFRSPAFAGPHAPAMRGILDKQIRILEEASRQAHVPDFAGRYRSLCDEMIALFPQGETARGD